MVERKKIINSVMKNNLFTVNKMQRWNNKNSIGEKYLWGKLCLKSIIIINKRYYYTKKE